jgi:hypothetical protein
VYNLFEDLKDGTVILQAFDKVVPGSVTWRRVSKAKEGQELSRFKAVENTNYAVDLAKGNQMHIVGIQGADIVDGSKTLTLGLVWQLMRLNISKTLDSLGKGGKGVSDQDMVRWANGVVQGAGKSSSMRSFKDPSLKTAHFFLDLLEGMRKGIVDYSLVTPGRTEEEQRMNAKLAISIARKLGALIFLVPEDIVELRQRLILTFVGSLSECGAALRVPPKLTPRSSSGTAGMIAPASSSLSAARALHRPSLASFSCSRSVCCAAALCCTYPMLSFARTSEKNRSCARPIAARSGFASVYCRALFTPPSNSLDVDHPVALDLLWEKSGQLRVDEGPSKGEAERQASVLVAAAHSDTPARARVLARSERAATKRHGRSGHIARQTMAAIAECVRFLPALAAPSTERRRALLAAANGRHNSVATSSTNTLCYGSVSRRHSLLLAPPLQARPARLSPLAPPQCPPTPPAPLSLCATHLGILEQLEVLLGKAVADLVVVDALCLLALLQLLAHDARLHGAHPVLAHLGVARIERRCGGRTEAAGQWEAR